MGYRVLAGLAIAPLSPVLAFSSPSSATSLLLPFGEPTCCGPGWKRSQKCLGVCATAHGTELLLLNCSAILRDDEVHRFAGQVMGGIEDIDGVAAVFGQLRN